MKHVLILLTVAMVLAGAGSNALAQGGAAVQGRGQVILSWDEFVKITGYDPAKKGSQEVAVSWKDLEGILGVQVNGVRKETMIDLPWKDFMVLLKWSVDQKTKQPADAEPAPPADYVVSSAEYSGKLTDTGAELVLKAKLNILRKKGWKRIAILPLSVAVVKSTLPKDVYLNNGAKAYEPGFPGWRCAQDRPEPSR